jgi:steroid delta-isomerase-like uncharacterized protein
MSTTISENKDLVRDYLHAFNEQDRDTLSELLAEGVVEHGSHEKRRDFDEIMEYLDALFQTFPDYSGSTDEMVAEDGVVVVRYTAHGTHEGEYEDVEPTGNNVEWTGMGMYRIEDDKIAEIWLEEDRSGLLKQLDVTSPPAHLRI